MIHFDKVIGASALILGLFSVGGMLSTDAYVHGAKAQAKGYDAFNKMIVNDNSAVCMNDATPADAGKQTQTQTVTQ